MSHSKTSPVILKKLKMSARALELRQEGKTFARIAAELDVSPATVHNWVSEAIAELRGELHEAAERHRDMDLLRLDRLLATVLPLANAGTDPRWVEKALQILDRRARLLGLDAPTKTQAEITTPLSSLSDEEVRQRAIRLGIVKPEVVGVASEKAESAGESSDVSEGDSEKEGRSIPESG